MDDEIRKKLMNYVYRLFISIPIVMIILYCLFLIIQIAFNLQWLQKDIESPIDILFIGDFLVPKINLGRYKITAMFIILSIPDIFIPIHWYSIYSVLKKNRGKYTIRNHKTLFYR